MRRARVARNCSGRLEVGGGRKRGTSLGCWGGGPDGGGCDVGSEEANGVRVSEGGIRGKEALEKT